MERAIVKSQQVRKPMDTVFVGAAEENAHGDMIR